MPKSNIRDAHMEDCIRFIRRFKMSPEDIDRKFLAEEITALCIYMGLPDAGKKLEDARALKLKIETLR